MKGYVVLAKTTAYEVGERGGELIAACVCGSGRVLPNKGLGRASIATWTTRHRDCKAAPR